MCISLSKVVKEHPVLCLPAKALSLIGSLAWRLIVWIKDLLICAHCRTVKKIDNLPKPYIPPPVRDYQKPVLIGEIAAITSSFLTFREFAKLRVTCTQFAHLSIAAYLKNHPQFMVKLLHYRVNLDYPSSWREGLIQAAAGLKELEFKREEILDHFPAIQPLFPKLSKLIFSIYRKHPKDLLDIQRALRFPIEEIVFNCGMSPAILPELFRHPHLKRLEFRHSSYPSGGEISEKLPIVAPLSFLELPLKGHCLERLNLKEHFQARLNLIARLGSLRTLITSLPSFSDVTEQEQANALMVLTKRLPHLTSLTLRESTFTPAIMQALSGFAKLRHLSLGKITLKVESIRALSQLSRLSSIELDLELEELESEEQIAQESRAIEILAEIQNLKKVNLQQTYRFYSAPPDRESRSLEMRRLIRMIQALASQISSIQYSIPEITDPEFLASCPPLVNCTLLEIELINGPKNLRKLLEKMPRLVKLSLDVGELKMEGEEEIGFELAHLRTLVLVARSVSAPALAKLSQWRMPALQSIEVVFLHVEQIKVLLANKRVQYFSTELEEVSDEFLHYLAQNQPALTALSIRSETWERGGITDSGLKALKKLPLLKVEHKIVPSYKQCIYGDFDFRPIIRPIKR